MRGCSGNRNGRDSAAIVLIAPLLALFFVTRLAPAIAAAIMSLTDYSVFRPTRFVGLSNFELLLHDALYIRALLNTFAFASFTAASTSIAGTALALLLNQQLYLRALFRSIFYLPVALSLVAVSQIWGLLLNPALGITAILAGITGLSDPNLLNNPATSLATVSLVTTWKNAGYAAIVYLAALQAISGEVYEAARVDGLTSLTQLRMITLPHMASTIRYFTLLLFLSQLQAFDQVYSLTGGGPVGATSTVVFQIYKEAFGYFHLGYAAAMAFMTGALVILAFIGVQRAALLFGNLRRR